MGKFVKVFVFVLCMVVISAMPLEGNEEEAEPQVDLLSFESVPQEDALVAAVNEDLTRAKRHHGGGGFGGYGGKIQTNNKFLDKENLLGWLMICF